jgi:hypothetical protein
MFNWLKSVWSWLTSSSTANSATLFLAQGAGTAAAVGIIVKIGDNKAGTAADIESIADAITTLLTGTIPSSSQISGVLTNLKSNSATQNYASIAQQFVSAFQSQLTSWSAAGESTAIITQYAKAFITGMQTGADLYAAKTS